MRVNEEEVRSIMDEPVDEVVLTPFITAANLLVNKVSDNDTASLLGTADLKEIERWLSAHMVSSSLEESRQLKSKSTDGASGSFAGDFGKGFDSTSYGQMAKRLDVTGYLKDLDNQSNNPNIHKAAVIFGGTEYSAANRNIH